MSVLVGKEAPDFTAQAVMGDNSIKADFNLKSYLKGKVGILFFYPLDFTFVCPSEIIAFDNRVDEFKKRGAEIIGVSVDSQYSHSAWKNTPVEKGGIGNIRFPLVADLTKSIARSYDVLTGDALAFRGTFMIDKKGIVRFTTIYPGYYAGRALHIHVAVRITAGNNYLEERHVAWVGQLYFPEIASRSVLNAREYSGRAVSPLTNDQDFFYETMGGEASTLNVHAIGRDSNEDGFFGHMTIGVDTFAVSSQIKPEDFDKYTV